MKVLVLVFCFLPLLVFSQTKEEVIKSAKDSLYKMNQEAAITILSNYLKIDSSDAEIYYQLGLAKSASRYYSVFYEFDKAFSIDSTHYESLMQRAGFYYFNDKPELALLDYQKAYSLTKSTYSLREIANTSISLGRFHEAIKILSGILESENDKIAIEYRAHAYFLLGEYSKAINDYESINLGSLPPNYWELSESYSKVGRREDACETINLLVSFWPCENDIEDEYCAKTMMLAWEFCDE